MSHPGHTVRQHCDLPGGRLIFAMRFESQKKACQEPVPLKR